MKIIQIEANIDDMNPEWYQPLMENLFAAGARDVALIPAIMKKGRPGVKVEILCDASKRAKLSLILLEESTTLGVRFWSVQRQELAREVLQVKTPYGSVQIKVGRDARGKIINQAPEYESCRKLAEAQKSPIKLIYQAAMQAKLS